MADVPPVMLALGVVVLLSACGSGDYTAYVRGYQPIGDGHQLTLFVETGPCDKITDTHVDQTASSVSVVVHAHRVQSNAPDCQTLAGETQTVNIELKDPLGTRNLIGESGNPLPQVNR